MNPAKPGILRDDFHGVLFTPPQSFPGVASAGPFLSAILLTGPELEVAQRFGHLRLMATLGRARHFYPTVPWADRGRRQIVDPSALGGSVLESLRPTHLHGASVRLEQASASEPLGPGSRVVLRLRPSAASRLGAAFEKLGVESGYVMSMDLDPEADALLAWSPGDTSLSVIGLAGSKCARIAGNFLVVAPGLESDGVTCVEDGFTLRLTGASFGELRSAIEGHRPIEIVATGGDMNFALAWIEVETS